MKSKIILALTALLLSCTGLAAQGAFFGVKGGLSAGSQKWNNFSRAFLYRGHIAATVESNSETSNRDFYAQLGYHQRGSTLRSAGIFTQNGVRFRPPNQEFIFNNISFGFGVKQKLYGNSKIVPFYSLGLRAEYTIDTNIDEFDREQPLFYSAYFFETFVKKFVYGVSAGGGIEYPFSEFVEGILEISLHPDIGPQYDQLFPLENIANPRDPGGRPITIPPRQVRNFTLEISVGIRFLRKVIYIE